MPLLRLQKLLVSHFCWWREWGGDAQRRDSSYSQIMVASSWGGALRACEVPQLLPPDT